MISYENIKDLDMFIKDNFDISVRRNNLTKKAYKIAFIKEKLDKRGFAFLAKKLSFFHNLRFNSQYKGFIIEEVEYIENKTIKTAKEMQEEFLKNKSIKKLDDGGAKTAETERKTKSHRDSLYNETNYDTKYDGIVCYSDKNEKFEIKFIKRLTGKENALKREIYHINYYNVLTYGQRRVIKESTVERLFQEGILTIEPKDMSVFKARYIEDESFYNEDNFN